MPTEPKGKRPATQFYWGDWLNCKELRVCSIAARGLWMDMLAYMRQGKPIGHLTHESGQPITTEQLARLVGEPATTVKKLLTELEANGVPGKTSNGVYTSRRMIREEAAYERFRQDAAVSGKRGAKTRWKGRQRRRDDDDGPPNGSGTGHRGPHTNPMNFDGVRDGGEHGGTDDVNHDVKHDSSSSSSNTGSTSTNKLLSTDLRTSTASGIKNARHDALTLARVLNFRRQRSKHTENGRPKFSTIRALARSVIQEHPHIDDDGELEAVVMQRCARDANLLYTSAIVKRAVEQARAQLRRRRTA